MPKNASARDIAAHAEKRSFYNLTGGKNILDYITTEGKRAGNNALDYLQKNTGVFNKDGMIEKAEVEAMKQRAAKNEGNIWSGFISLNEEESKKIDTPEKCISLVKRTFGKFFKDAGLDENNLDLMCALHLDRPHHLHIHFVCWEKEAKYKNEDGTYSFRKKGKIKQSAIDNMFVSLGLAIDDDKDKLYKSRDIALKELREMTSIKSVTSNEEIKKAVIQLSKDLPKTGRLTYASSDMEAFRGRVDGIVKMLLDYDGDARKADKEFYKALAERERKVKNICGKPFAFSDKNISDSKVQENLPKYNYKIDESKIKLIAEIEADYKRRQGNLVLNLAKFIKPELFERKQGKSYKKNDNALKRVISISEKKVDRLFKRFIQTFGRDFGAISREHRNRLREIEDEMKREKQAEGHYAHKQEIQEKEDNLNIGQKYGTKT